MKKLLKLVIGVRLFNYLRNKYRRVNSFKELIIEYARDFKLYYKFSSAFNRIDVEQYETIITLRYHSIEKGLLHSNIRYRFAKEYVAELIGILRKPIIDKCNITQVKSAVNALINYYKIHEDKNEDISDYFTDEDYLFLKKLEIQHAPSIKEFEKRNYFKNSYEDFYKFSNSRSSVRHFTGERVSKPKIHKAISLAANSPSVCNRQPNKVLIINDKTLVDKVLDLQKGFKGYEKNVRELLILYTSRKYFYSVGERNQMYIDGGVFLLNLLYALHYYHIAACPAHWAHGRKINKAANTLLKLDEGSQIICLIPIGIPEKKFKTCLSSRKSYNEILSTIN